MCVCMCGGEGKGRAERSLLIVFVVVVAPSPISYVIRLVEEEVKEEEYGIGSKFFFSRSLSFHNSFALECFKMTERISRDVRDCHKYV